MTTQRGPSDVLLFCDGWSRSCRGEIEKLATDARNVAETVVVYVPTTR